MKTILILLIFIMSFISLKSETWEYYSLENNDEIHTHNTYFDGNKTIYLTKVFKNDFFSFNIESIKYTKILSEGSNKDFFNKGKGCEDIAVDLKGEVWFLKKEFAPQLEEEDGLFKLSGDTLISMNHLLPDSIRKNFYGCKFDKTPEDNLIFGKGYELFFLEEDTIRIVNTKNTAIPDLLLNDNNKYDYIGNNMIIAGETNMKYGLFFFNRNNMKECNTYLFDDYGINRDSVELEKIIAHNNKVYMLFTSKSKPAPIFNYHHSYIYVWEAGKIRKLLSFDSEWNLINDFVIDKKDRLIIPISSFSYNSDTDNCTLINTELRYHNLDGSIIKTYSAPKFIVDANGNLKGEEHQLAGIFGCYIIDNYLYFTSDASGHAGYLKFNPDATSVLANIEGQGARGSAVWIYNISPNPVENQTTIDFFCLPDYIDNFNLEIYDILGTKSKNFSYHILNFNYSTGHGQLQLNINSAYSGAKYLVMTANGETYTKGIMLK